MSKDAPHTNRGLRPEQTTMLTLGISIGDPCGEIDKSGGRITIGVLVHTGATVHIIPRRGTSAVHLRKLKGAAGYAWLQGAVGCCASWHYEAGFGWVGRVRVRADEGPAATSRTICRSSPLGLSTSQSSSGNRVAA